MFPATYSLSKFLALSSPREGEEFVEQRLENTQKCKTGFPELDG